MQKDLEGSGCFLGATRHTLRGAPVDGPCDALGGEPLGFLCIVDRERDRPVVVDESAAPLQAGEADAEEPTALDDERAKTDGQRP